MPDAATEFASLFDDPTRFVVKPQVPIFYAHDKTVVGEDGTERTETVSEADLPAWLAELQANQRQTGAAAVLRLGHLNLDPKATEDDQPPVGGYYRDPVIGRFGPERTLGILADEYAMADAVPTLKKAQRRSVEFFRNRKHIFAVAAISRPPQLPKLGYVVYHRGGERIECYRLDLPETTMDPTATGTPGTPDLNGIVAAVIAQLKSMGAIADAPPAPAPPAPGPDPAPADPVLMNDPARAELYALQTETRTLKKQNEAMAATLRRIQQERDEATVERYLTDLAAEGYQFDPAEERAELLRLADDAERKRYVSRVRKNYQQMPVGRVEVYQGAVEPGAADRQPKSLTREQQVKASEHQSATGKPWAECRQLALDGKL